MARKVDNYYYYLNRCLSPLPQSVRSLVAPPAHCLMSVSRHLILSKYQGRPEVSGK